MGVAGSLALVGCAPVQGFSHDPACTAQSNILPGAIKIVPVVGSGGGATLAWTWRGDAAPASIRIRAPAG